MNTTCKRWWLALFAIALLLGASAGLEAQQSFADDDTEWSDSDWDDSDWDEDEDSDWNDEEESDWGDEDSDWNEDDESDWDDDGSDWGHDGETEDDEDGSGWDTADDWDDDESDWDESGSEWSSWDPDSEDVDVDGPDVEGEIWEHENEDGSDWDEDGSEWGEGAELDLDSRDLDLEPQEDELGYLCYMDGTEKRITPDAAVWLAKMVDGETWGRPELADAESMLWALAQRTGIWGFRKWSLRKMIQAYSQPINPIWTRSGSKCAKYYKSGYSGSIPDKCSKKRTAKRASNIAKNWDETAEIARRAVLEFSSGQMANSLPGAVGWFAPGTWRSREKKGSNAKSHMVFHSEISGNVYFAMDRKPDTTGWDGREVMVVGPDEFCPMVVGSAGGGE